MMKTHDDVVFSDRPEILVTKVLLSYNYLGSIISTYGEFWRQLRKICVVELLTTKRVQSFWSLREAARNPVEEIHSLVGSPINLSEKVFLYTYNISSRSTFDRMRVKANKGEIEEDLVDVLLQLKDENDYEFPIGKNNVKSLITDLVTVVKETLRLHPPRESKERCELNGYEIPERTSIIVNAWAIARDPEYWNDAESFKPERFDDVSIDYKGTNFEYTPFGAGDALVIEDQVFEEGAKEWEDRVVGFFLGKKLPYTMVKTNVSKRWNLKGDFDLALDGYIYYFKFYNNEDRESVLDNGSFYIAQKLFVI
ncbi:hypothetical protein IFM89_010218 [Coptis chinensis]|uniref:DUF4283 domain-containing protein n=1 Tax=Coptis chinensis TaxID=261450 RepID=A0A835LE46_9MAGN|nr:hypothetical protein IFM89_010218 [Coptis chinensis]